METNEGTPAQAAATIANGMPAQESGEGDMAKNGEMPREITSEGTTAPRARGASFRIKGPGPGADPGGRE
ncbi:MAG: hypothetical protein NTW87_05630 [Planctomycetota bacterium]|nr:hypothetical protein [Planctomycetota bacterium]